MIALRLMLHRSWPHGLGLRSTASPARARAALVRVLGALARAYRMRRDTRQLLALSDHMLSDMGIGRGEIGQAVQVGRDWR